MASPKTATTSKSGSRYYTIRGANLFSATTLLKGGLPTGYGLQKWMKAATALGSIQEQDVIIAMLKKCETPEHCQKVTDYKDVCSECERIIDWLVSRPFTLTKKAADLGTDIHEAVEAHTLGKPHPPWKPAVAPRMEQFERFLQEWQPVFEQTEATVYNMSERYAGTLDAIVAFGPDCDTCDATGEVLGQVCSDCYGYKKINPRRLILDMKSGKGVYPEVALQLALYRNAEFILGPDGSENPMPQVDGACTLHLTDDHYELIDVDTGPDIFKTALYAREIYRWSTELSKTAIRGPLRLDAPPEVQVVGQMLLDGDTP